MRPGFDARRLAALGRVSAVAPSPCGQALVVQVDTADADGGRYRGSLWRVPLGDGAPHRLTQGKAHDRAPAFRPGGDLLFLSDRGDEGYPQVWCLPAAGGEAVRVTDEPLGVEGFQVARRGDALVLQAPRLPGVAEADQRATDEARRKGGSSALRYTALPVRYWDHYQPAAAPHLIAWSSSGSRDLTPGADRAHREGQWHLSADGRRVVVTARRPARPGLEDVDLLVIDVASGHTVRIDAGPGVALEEPRLSDDAARVVCVRSSRPAPPTYAPRLAVFDVATGLREDVAPGFDRFAHPVGFTADGEGVVLTADDHGRLPVFLFTAGAVVPLLDPAVGGSHTGVSLTFDGASVVGLRSTFTQPPEAFVAPLVVGATPHTPARLSGYDPAEVPVEIEEFSVAGAGGDAVHSFVLKAPGEERRPLLLWIHGGPMSAHADVWHWRWNPLVATAAGYVVALPNPRGSTGYGQAFVDGVWDNRFGAECYTDLMAVTDALQGRADVDAARMVAMGGSFGGYMTNLIGTRTDRFAALVSHAGLYHFPQFRGTTDDAGWFAYGFGFEPEADEDAFTRHSPHRHVGGWRTPTLVIHGDRDYRVPVGEALALFEALQRHGVDSELIIFPDENHWIMKPANVVAWYEAWLRFCAARLKLA
ncbi:MAG: S9 family peptidase [bacterium]